MELASLEKVSPPKNVMPSFRFKLFEWGCRKQKIEVTQNRLLELYSYIPPNDPQWSRKLHKTLLDLNRNLKPTSSSKGGNYNTSCQFQNMWGYIDLRFLISRCASLIKPYFFKIPQGGELQGRYEILLIFLNLCDTAKSVDLVLHFWHSHKHIGTKHLLWLERWKGNKV